MMMLKPLLTALALASLAACGQPATKADGAPAAQGGGPSEITLGATRTLPDWLLFARTADGGNVHFNQRTILRAADGLSADIWVQIQHGNTQLYAAEDAERTMTVAYVIERLHYRFSCADDRFTILNRQFMDSLDVVAAELPTPDAALRPVPPSGIARMALPIACRGN